MNEDNAIAYSLLAALVLLSLACTVISLDREYQKVNSSYSLYNHDGGFLYDYTTNKN